MTNERMWKLQIADVEMRKLQITDVQMTDDKLQITDDS